MIEVADGKSQVCSLKSSGGWPRVGPLSIDAIEVGLKEAAFNDAVFFEFNMVLKSISHRSIS